MCAIHAKRVTITPKDMELVDSLRVMNGGKSYNEKAYAAYTAKMGDKIDPNQGNKQYFSL
jgi:hypothetical protein